MIATLVTLAGMAVSIGQAKSALKSSQVAKNAVAAVQLAAIAERLKAAQEHIRDVAPDKVSQRGFKIGNRLDLIRREFDSALSALPKIGMGSQARTQLTSAQAELNRYQTSLSLKPSLMPTADSETWQKLQVFVQDAVSEITSTTSSLGELND